MALCPPQNPPSHPLHPNKALSVRVPCPLLPPLNPHRPCLCPHNLSPLSFRIRSEVKDPTAAKTLGSLFDTVQPPSCLPKVSQRQLLARVCTDMPFVPVPLWSDHCVRRCWRAGVLENNKKKLFLVWQAEHLILLNRPVAVIMISR